MTVRLLWLLSTLLFSAGAWADAPAASVLEAGAEREYTAQIEPGTLYTINFLSGPSGSDVAANFTTQGGPVSAMAIAHPRSDLVEVAGELRVDCPGLDRHSVRVSTASEPMVGGTVHSNSTEQGHFGFAFGNATSETIALHLTLVASRSSITTTFVGLVPGRSLASP